MPVELQDQSNFLPAAQVLIILVGLSLALLTSFIDTNAVGVALPTIGEDLDCSDTVSWVGTSGLIANAVFQVLYGRLSDIFGRKIVFLSAIGLLCVGDLLCSFAKSGPQLYVFRGIAGVGSGGIAALSMMILSDIVSLQDRGKYQGILGAMVGLGNTIGPFLAAAVIQKVTWRALFWIISPLAFVCGVTIIFLLPPSPTNGKPMEKVMMIDFYGVIASTAATLLVLIPLSGGGTYFPWDSSMVISMLVLGFICAVAFVIIEWKFAKLPIMPVHLFKDRAVAAILVQNFFFGIVYYSTLYYLPIYYQEARGYSPIVAAALTVPMVVAQSISSIISGQYLSWRGRYGEIIWVGFFLWTLGVGLVVMFSRDTSPAVMAVVLAIQGMGVGCVFQPTLVAIQAHSSKADRAVVISVRNYIRSLGGAAGLAISAAIYSNALKKAAYASDAISSTTAGIIEQSTFTTPALDTLSNVERDAVLDGYVTASRTVFISWVPMMGLCLILCILIKDRGLQRPEENVKTPPELVTSLDSEKDSVVDNGIARLEKKEDEKGGAQTGVLVSEKRKKEDDETTHAVDADLLRLKKEEVVGMTSNSGSERTLVTSKPDL